MSDDIIILSISIVGILAGMGGIVYIGYKNNYLNFLGISHWVSLLLLILAGIFTWIGMVWMVNPNFKVTSKQWISLGFSLGISILWWARYAYTTANDEEDDAP